ncbi:MAG: ribosome maturation factor RimM [Clostridia bacterium]|nr:ribosome maturation factor RimM [Clostridia bacterium]
MTQYLEIGKIVNTHGIKGEVKVIPLTDDPTRFEDLDTVLIEKNNSLTKMEIQNVKYFKSFVILKFEGISDMNTAETLKDLFIKIDRKDAVKLPEGSYFVFDILNSEVFEENGNRLGILTDILETGSNDVYVVKNETGREILIPALKSVVKEISIEKKTMIVTLPEGLVDDEI